MSADEPQSEDLRTLKRIEELLSVIAKVQLSGIIRDHLADANMRLLYDLTGEVPVEQLTKRTGFSAGKISGIWKNWETLGLLKKDGKRYRKVI